MNKIKDLRDGNVGVDDYLVSNVTSGVTNKGSKYLSVTVTDNSGSMEAKFWSVEPSDVEIVQKGKIVRFHYDINKYNTSLQMRINKVEKLDQDSVDASQYVVKSEIPLETLKDNLRQALKNIKDPIYKQIVTEMFKRIGDKFFTHPAASKNHHNYYSGLATHVYGMVQVGYALCKIYPTLNQDLLISGILLHDMGKVIELDSPIATSYTVEGNLIGHISIVHGLLMEVEDQLGVSGSEQGLLLRHMVLAHHGQFEFGSPVRPALMEAEALYYIDNIDAKMNMLQSILANVEPGEFSDRIFALENRRFYKPKDETC